jgi:hypothetical protein
MSRLRARLTLTTIDPAIKQVNRELVNFLGEGIG